MPLTAFLKKSSSFDKLTGFPEVTTIFCKQQQNNYLSNHRGARAKYSKMLNVLNVFLDSALQGIGTIQWKLCRSPFDITRYWGRLEDSSVRFRTKTLNPNLGGRGYFYHLLVLFSLNNSETVKAVTLAFCSIQYFLLKTFALNVVSLTHPSLQTLGKTQA